MVFILGMCIIYLVCIAGVVWYRVRMDGEWEKFVALVFATPQKPYCEICPLTSERA